MENAVRVGWGSTQGTGSERLLRREQGDRAEGRERREHTELGEMSLNRTPRFLSTYMILYELQVMWLQYNCKLSETCRP